MMRRISVSVLIMVSFIASAAAAEVQPGDPRPAQLGMFCTVHHGGSPAAPSTWIRVEQLAPGAAAERAGLRAGDMITEINGEPLKFHDEVELLLAIARLEVGKPATLTVLRGNQRQTITVLPTRMSAAQYEQWKVGLVMLQAQRAQRAAAAAPK
jgi:S1-C subfamily serine protease